MSGARRPIQLHTEFSSAIFSSGRRGFPSRWDLWEITASRAVARAVWEAGEVCGVSHWYITRAACRPVSGSLINGGVRLALIAGGSPGRLRGRNEPRPRPLLDFPKFYFSFRHKRVIWPVGKCKFRRKKKTDCFGRVTGRSKGPGFQHGLVKDKSAQFTSSRMLNGSRTRRPVRISSGRQRTVEASRQPAAAALFESAQVVVGFKGQGRCSARADSGG